MLNKNHTSSILPLAPHDSSLRDTNPTKAETKLKNMYIYILCRLIRNIYIHDTTPSPPTPPPLPTPYPNPTLQNCSPFT